MPRGTLEVLLIRAKGLDNSDFFNNIDPYVILTCRTQEQKSSVASGQGSEPEWNENFIFNLSDGVSSITLKLMDKDRISADDLLGQTTISLEPLFMEGKLPPTSYNVVKDQKFCGEIRLALAFIPEESNDRGYEQEENYGGWKESSY